jgi:hypothetical protein
MPSIPLGQTYNVRMAAATPPYLLTNMVLEKDPTNLVDGMARIQRPALDLRQSVGSGPIETVYQAKGLFGDDMLVISGTELWRVPVLTQNAPSDIGSVGQNAGTCQFASGAGQAVLAAPNLNAYSYNGTALSQINIPNGDPISSVAYLDSYFYLSKAGTQLIYFISPGETAPGGLEYFSAEAQADNVLALGVLTDELWIFKEADIEVWSPSGDLNAPLTRQPGRLYNRGIANRDTLVTLDNTLFWVGNDRIVYRAGSVPQAISDNSVAELVRRASASSLKAWSFSLDQHVYYVLTTNLGTVAYDVTTQKWSQWTSAGQPTWRGAMGYAVDGSTVVAGDAYSANLYTLDPLGVTDNGDPITRVLVGGVPVSGPTERCDNVEVVAALGQTASTSAPATLSLDWSDDQGNTWSAPVALSLHTQGQFAGRAYARMLGRMRSPGRVFRFTTADPALTRISYARYNEAFA